MRISTSSQINNLKFSMMNKALDVDKYQQQIASGEKYQKYSDEPLLANQELILKNSMAKIEQYEKNVKDANMYLASAESSLGQVVNLMQEVKNVALEAKNGTASAEDLRTYKLVVEENIKQLEGLANTQFLGKYLFAGEKTQTKPYEISNGVNGYQGDNEAFKIRVSATKEMEISIPGGEVFQQAFDAMIQMREALENGTEVDLNMIEKGLNKVIDSRSEIGVRMESATMYEKLYSNEKLNLETRISAVEDADLSEAMINLTQTRLIQESILAITSKMYETSLLNYLK